MDDMTPAAVVSRRGADRLRSGHPWIFRTDVVSITAEPGDIVRITTERGRPMGWAYWSSASQIALRLIDPSTESLPGERALVTERIRSAAAYRATLGPASLSCRLVHGEADRLPATIVDRYSAGAATYFVVQTLAQGSDRRLGLLVDALVELFAPAGIIARNDPKVRALEGLETQVEVLHGHVPDHIEVEENGTRFLVDLRGGQKTGLFLDQRENHAAAARYTAGEALDAFTYNGGFALQMAPRAARVLALDASAQAVEATRGNAERNGLTNVEVAEANVFDALRELEAQGRRFDTIALDPPAFARSRASVERAIGGYKEINLRAMRLLHPGGYLITCSCSYNVGDALFLDIVRQAAADARARMWLVERRGQAADHPVLVTAPETSYLKCLVLRRAG